MTRDVRLPAGDDGVGWGALLAQWAHLADAWPGLLAAAFARFEASDPARWAVLEALRSHGGPDPLPLTAPPGHQAGRSECRRASTTTAALGLLTDRAHFAAPASAA